MYFRLIISIVTLILRIHITEKQLSRCNQCVAYFLNSDSRIHLRLFRFPREKNMQFFRLLKQFLRIFIMLGMWVIMRLCISMFYYVWVKP